MPLYDYACESCGHAIEVMHGVNGSGPQNCERCGGRMRKLLSPPAIVFKGSGWAKKDARAARPAGARSGTDTESDSGSATPASSTADAGKSGADTAGSGAASGTANSGGAAADA